MKLLDGDTDYGDLFSDYAKIQDVDYYHSEWLKYVVMQQPEHSIYCFGYEGVITQEGYYLRYNDGREEYYSCKSGDPVTEDWVQRARELCPYYPADLIEHEKFKYSRNVYATLNRYLARNQEFEDKKFKCICEILEEKPACAVIALRGGGVHTYRLWMLLPWELRRRITFAIDRDPDCPASRVGLSVINVQELQEKQVDYVIVSSFEYEREWLEELKDFNLNAKVLGLYQELEKKGVVCYKAFYFKEYSEEDKVWEI